MADEKMKWLGRNAAKQRHPSSAVRAVLAAAAQEAHELLADPSLPKGARVEAERRIELWWSGLRGSAA